MIIVNSRNLEAEMVREGISRKDVAELLGVSDRTIYSRINGKSEWTYGECIMIKENLFPDLTLDYLFPYEQMV